MGSTGRASRGSSWREARERSVSRQILPTTVVSQPAGLSISSESERLRRSQVSWTASCVSPRKPSMR